MKSDTVYKRTFNQFLDLIAAGQVGELLPSETELAARLMVSRTTVRKVMGELAVRGIIRHDGRARVIERQGVAGLHFPVVETVSTSDQVERRFLEWMLRGDTKPGAMINELEMARTFSVGTNGIREFLNRFSRYGLIEKRPNSGWLFKGFTEAFALELFEIRLLFELRSARLFAQTAPDAAIWPRLEAMRAEHMLLLDEVEARYQDFSGLDNRFHRLVNEAAPNRFIDDFYDIITLIFHYHYQWNKQHELERNRIAIIEHLAYIDALESRDPARIEASCRTHLNSARETLILSLVRFL